MSEYLSDEEQMARMKSWWDEYGTSVIAGVVIAVVGLVGWQWYGSHSKQQTAAAAELYSAYLDGDAAQQQQIVQQLAAEHPGGGYHSLTLFDQARQAVEGGDLAAAAERLKTVVSTSDHSLLVDLARLRLARVQHGLDQTGEALALLTGIKHEGYRALALETKGDIHMSEGEVEVAHQAYAAAVEALADGDDRPLLKMKLDNTAPFAGEFVQLQDSLEDALRDATRVLEDDEEVTVPDVTAEDTSASDGGQSAPAETE